MSIFLGIIIGIIGGVVVTKSSSILKTIKSYHNSFMNKYYKYGDLTKEIDELRQDVGEILQEMNNKLKANEDTPSYGGPYKTFKSYNTEKISDTSRYMGDMEFIESAIKKIIDQKNRNKTVDPNIMKKAVKLQEESKEFLDECDEDTTIVTTNSDSLRIH